MDLFPKTRQKIETQLNDRVTAPVKTSVILSITALTVAVIALMVAVGNANR